MTTKTKPEFNVNADKATLKNLLSDASDVKTMMEGQRDTLKSLRDEAKDKLGLEPKVFNKLLTMHHKRNRAEVEAETDELVEIYDKTFQSDAV